MPVLPFLLALAPLLLAGGSPVPAESAPRTAWVDVVVATPEGGHRQGNPNAPVKLVEYGSRSCPTCRRFAVEGVGPLRANYIATGKVSYEYREYPVHSHDIANILLGRCVPAKAFFPVLDAMFADQAAANARMAALSDAEFARIQALPILQAAAAIAEAAGYVDFMKRRGLSAQRIGQCLSDAAALETLGNRVAAARAAGVRGTPTFFINGKQPEHAHSWAELEPLLKAAGA